jgi:molybdenum cofactor cytidylyltransferase
MKKEIAIIILAAGSSSRMGQPKQQLLIDGKPLLVRTVETALRSEVGKVTVVLGALEESHRHLLKELPVDITFNPKWQTGMGSSLKAGLSHALSINQSTEAIIVLVCDQPLLQSHQLKSLVEKYKSTNALIVASAYTNTTGVPALFNQKIFGEILGLDDSHGAKKIIQQHQDQVEMIPFPEGAIDLDTPEEYHNFVQSKKMP